MNSRSSGALLRQARHRARISQASVAALIGATQTRVSRWESGEIDLPDHQLDEALAMCGAQRSGPHTLSDLLTPLQGDDQLHWYGLQAPAERIRITSLHCSAAGRPLAGVSWPALLGALKIITGMSGCAVGGAVARSLTSPDRSNDPDLDYLDLLALAASPAWGLPARLPMMQIRVTQIDETQAQHWSSWPPPCGWPDPLVLAHHKVQPQLALGRSGT